MANCDNLITNQDLENAKQNADTYKVVIESDLPTTTTPDGKTIFTLTGLSQQISFIYPPILWEPGLTVDNALQLYEVPASASGDTGSFLVFPFVENLPFVTGPTYDPSKWTVLQYSKENLDQAVADAEAQAQVAEQEADRAESEADRSTTQADRAQSEADRAEQAALQAALNGGFYLTVADGIAATSDGDLFLVISSQPGIFANLYLNDNNVGVDQGKSLIDSEFFDEQITDGFFGDGKYAFAVADSLGRVSLAVDSKGEVVAVTSFRDESNKLEDNVNKIEIGSITPAAMSELNFIVCRGQSNAIGRPGALTTSPIDKAFMLGATNSFDLGAVSFTPLAEDSGGADVETIVSGFSGQQISMVGSSIPNYIKFEHDIVAGCSGASGVPITSLIQGTGLYNNSLSGLQTAKNIADSNSQDLVHSAWFWLQGESDDTTDISTYKSTFVQMKSDWETDSAAITSQSIPPKCFTYQVRAGNATRAHYELMRDNSDITIPCPSYFLPFADSIHYEPHGIRQMSAYFAKAYYISVIEGKLWRPLYPTNISVTSNQFIDITFNVPGKRLEWGIEAGFDTNDTQASQLVGAIVNGFSIVEPNDLIARYIERIDITGRDSLRITMTDSTQIQPGDVIRYGITGVRDTPGGTLFGSGYWFGILRDDGSDIETLYNDASGEKYKMYNWCVSFQEAL